MITKNIDGNPISQSFVDAITDSVTGYTMRLVVEGSALECSIVYAEIAKGSAGDENGFTIGNVIGDSLTATVNNLSDQIKGKVIDCQIGLNDEYISLGRFTVSQVKIKGLQTEIIAYSSVISETGAQFDYSNLTTYTIADIVNSLRSQLGCSITLDSSIDTSFIIEALPIAQTIYQTLGIVATTCGGYVINTNDGNIAVHQFNDTVTYTVQPDRMTNLPEFAEEPFLVDSVLCYVAHATTDADGNEIVPSYFGTLRTNLKAGDKYITDENDVPILVNTTVDSAVLAFNSEYMSKEMFVGNIWDILGYEYYPAELSMTIGDPRLEGDDVLGVIGIDGNTYTVPCHKIIHRYTGGLVTKVTAVESTAEDRKVGTALPLSERIADVEQTAESALGIAGDTNQYFWFVGQGSDTGAHITEVPRAEFLADPANGGGNLLARSNGVALRNGLTELANFTPSSILLGGTSSNNVLLNTSGLSVREGTSELAKFAASGSRVGKNSDGEYNINVRSNGIDFANGSTVLGTISANESSFLGDSQSLTVEADVSTLKTAKLYLMSTENTLFGGDYAIASLEAENDGNKASLSVSAEATGSGIFPDSDVQAAGSTATVYLGGGSSFFGPLHVTRKADSTSLLDLTTSGNLSIAGTLTQGSDRRLKEHISYLGQDAVEFVRKLKPAYYRKNSQNHVGFYAQDIESEDIWHCMTGEMNGFKTLGYTEIIAPLVAYCQHLEKRIETLERSR